MYYLSCRKDVVLYMRYSVVEYCLCVLKLADMMVSPWKIRSCEFCSENVLEDEYHFMCSCDLYDDLRDSLYTNDMSVYLQFPDPTSNEKFINLMKNCQNPAAKYAKAAFDRRRKILYQWLWVAACPLLCIILFVVTYKPYMGWMANAMIYLYKWHPNGHVIYHYSSY